MPAGFGLSVPVFFLTPYGWILWIVVPKAAGRLFRTRPHPAAGDPPGAGCRVPAGQPAGAGIGLSGARPAAIREAISSAVLTSGEPGPLVVETAIARCSQGR